jgi:hypothetical protein
MVSPLIIDRRWDQKLQRIAEMAGGYFHHASPVLKNPRWKIQTVRGDGASLAAPTARRYDGVFASSEEAVYGD